MSPHIFALAVAKCDVAAVGYKQTDGTASTKIYYAILKSGAECIISETQFTEIKKHIAYINTLK